MNESGNGIRRLTSGCLKRLTLAAVVLGLAVWLAFSAASTTAADRKPERLTVLDDRAYPPFSFLDQSGSPTGITIDLFKLWSEKTGIPVEFHLMDWEDVLSDVREGRADVVGGMFQTSGREGFFDYSRELFEVSAAIFFHDQITGIRRIDDARGFRIGVVREDSSEEWVLSELPGADLAAYGNAEEMIRDAVDGRIKVFVADVPTALYYLAAYPGGGSYRHTKPVYSSTICPGVRKGNSALLSVLATGFDQISVHEIDGVVARWGGRPAQRALPWAGIALTTVLVTAFAVVGLLWTSMLQKRIRAVTRDLREKNQALSAANEALRQSEKRFRLIFENAPYAITVNRLSDGAYLDANPAFLKDNNLTKEDLEAFSNLRFFGVSKDHQEAVITALKQDGMVHNVDVTVTKPDETDRHILYSSVLMTIDEEPDAGVLTMVVDVTEQVEVRKSLARSEEKFRNIFQNAPIGIYRSSLDGRILEANQTLAGMLGYEDSDALIASVNDLASDVYADPEQRRRLLDQLSRRGSIRMELDWKRRDGSVFAAVINASLVMDDQGNPSYIEGTIEDVTSLKHAEILSRKLAAAIEQSGEIVVITDRMGVIQYVNRAFEKITGYSRQEAVGGKPSLLKSGRHDQSFYADLWRTIAGGRTWRGRIVNKARNGSLFTEEATISPVFDDDGTIVNYVAAKRDITQKIAREEHQRQAQKMEALGTLAGGVAHDFNNILSGIFGYAQLAGKHVENTEKARGYIDQLVKGAQRATELVQQILTFSRKSDFSKRPIQISVIVKEALKLLSSSLPATITFREEIHSRTRVLSDPTRIHQIVMNLCTNAYHAMRETGGVLTVGLHEVSSMPEGVPEPPRDYPLPGKFLKLSVRDTGCGMDELTMRRVFDPYFTTKSKGDGTGMGLALVKAIAEEHSGFVRVESEPGKGSEFSVFLPVLESPTEDGLVEPGQESLPGGTESIMIVDDEEAIRDISCELLSAMGYRPTVFPNGLEALEAFQAQPERFDLVITDMTMPGMTGDELSQKILAIRSDVPIILCTGYSDRISREQSGDIGIREYLMKPVPNADLARTVRAVLNAAAKA